MEVEELIKTLDFHKFLVGENQIYLRASKEIMTLASASNSGIIFVSKIKTNCVFQSVKINIEILNSLIKGKKNVELSVDQQSLVVRGKNIKGSIPFNEVESFPRVGKIESDSYISKNDAEWLTSIIPLLTLKSVNKTGHFAAQCKDNIWSIACNDNMHGAFTFSEGNSNITFSLLPEDSLKLNRILKEFTSLVIGIQSNQLMLKNENISISIPCIEGSVQSKEVVTKNTKLICKLQLPSLKEAVKSIYAIATKSNSTVTLNIKENELILFASSDGGSLKCKIASETMQQAEIKIPFELFNNLMNQMQGVGVSVYAYKENSEITRLSFKVSGIYYLMLTSG